MNILISSPVHWWNAEAAYAASLAEVLLEAGHRAWVLTRPDTLNHQALVSRGLPLLTEIPLWASNPLRLWGAIGDLRAFQERESIQIVNIFNSMNFPWHVLASRGRAAPSLVRTRGSAQRIKGHLLNRRLYRRGCQGLIASSETVRHEMLATLRMPPEAVRTIYFPIDLPELGGAEAQREKRAALLRELSLPPETVLLGIVGRVFPEKGHRELLQALSLLAPRFPNLALLVLAKAVDDPEPYRRELGLLEEALGLTQRVRWLGHRPDVREMMGGIDVGVVPSLASEVNCRVTVEFFSMGTPVVAFPTGALPEVIEDGLTGRVTRTHEAAELAEVLAVLIVDAATRKQMGEQARRAAETRFSRARFLEQTLAVYRTALGQGH